MFSRGLYGKDYVIGEKEDEEVFEVNISVVLSYSSNIYETNLIIWRHLYGIDPSIHLRVPAKDERSYDLRNKDKIVFYEQMFKVSFFLPFGTELRGILLAIGAAPTQLAPNA